MENDSGNRICYVDPNDVRGNINGVPLTPDYTDFSIWCNLIVERSTRVKNQEDRVDTTDTFGISWDLSNANVGSPYASFFTGKPYNDYRFLTTDYTNIDYNEIKNRNIIEGLQIESIDIGFTNYQTPQVTIKFIDIRGGGFFGREEATHNEYGKVSNLSVDENNKLIDNFYSCFVSFPYPRFKLQVKGFYGKPVTFQLTCTSFNGNFNAQTGNFEIVVQFIGYEYGILGDIPFNLLVAAPMVGAGKEYWDNHQYSKEWQLSKDGDAPIKLFDFFRDIKAEISPADKTPKKEENRESVLLGINQQISKLTLIKQYITEFKTLLNEKYGGKGGYVIDCVNDNENVIFLFNSNGKFIVDKELCDKRNQIQELITEYNDSYSSSEFGGAIINTLIPNFDNNINWASQEVEAQYFIQYNKADGKTNIPNVSPNTQIISNNQIIDYKNVNVLSFVDTEIVKVVSGGVYKITNGISQELIKNLIMTRWFIYHQGYAPYAAVIDLGAGVKNIDDKLTTLSENYKNIIYNYELMAQKDIQLKVGMIPYIGRYYKMVMCHLETFIQVIKKCVDGIYDQMNGVDGKGTRTPASLGIRNLDMETDVPMERGGKANQQQVPPFPAVYRKYQTAGEAKEVLNLSNNEEIKANAWIGDFEGDWLERDLVDEIYDAAQNIEADKDNNRASTPITSRNRVGDNRCLNPFNFIHKVPDYPYASLDGMLLYIGLKAEITLNMMQSGGGSINNNLAKNLGMYDAYWLIKNCKDDVLLNELKNVKLYDSIVLTNVFQNTLNNHEFEFVIDEKYNKRHPIFVEDDKNNVEYVYMTNGDDGVEFIPCGACNTLVGRVPFSVEYNYTTLNSFIPKKSNSGSFVVYGTTPSKIKQYENTGQFSIITNIGDITAFRNTYSDFKTSSNKIGDTPTKTINTALSQYIYVDESRTNSFYKYNSEYKSYNSQGIDNLNENSSDDDLDSIDRKTIMNKY